MMAWMFHVFVEGAKDGPTGVKKLAAAIAQHYGLSAPDMERRFASGRFRVKGNCDRATADRYKADLEKLGAICTIEAATAANSYPTPPAGMPVVRPPSGSTTPPTGLAAAGLAAARPASSSTPPSGLAAARPASSSTPPSGLAAARPASASTPPGGTPQFASGLSAAFSGEMPAASLGALEGGSLSLASVDGSDDAAGAPPAASFAPPEAVGVPASIGPAPEKPKAVEKKQKPKDVPVDLFMPPEAESANLSVDLAAEEMPKKRASTPQPMDSAPAAAAPPLRRSQPSIQVPSEPVTAVAAKPSHPLGDERVRFVAGVVLAILIGFVPAHFIASMREKSVFDDIDAKVNAIQAEVTTVDDWNRLDQQRDDLLARKKSSQRSVAIMAFLIWGVVGGGVAYGWFKRINWERFEA
jgi:hypothetical protein